jgi:hypothetical protein
MLTIASIVALWTMSCIHLLGASMRSSTATIVIAISACVAVTPSAMAQLTLPKAMKGNSNYQNQVNSAWSLVITKTNGDGTFEGAVSYAGRRCNADKTPITNGRIKDGEVRFNVWMGPQCSENTFALRPGKQHLLEGEFTSNVAPGAAQVWLDPDS